MQQETIDELKLFDLFVEESWHLNDVYGQMKSLDRQSREKM